MLKKYAAIGIILGICGLFPLRTVAGVTNGMMQTEQVIPSIQVEGNSLTISQADGMTLEIYTLTGSKTASYVIEGNQVRIRTNLQKGWYILKLGTIVRKIAIK